MCWSTGSWETSCLQPRCSILHSALWAFATTWPWFHAAMLYTVNDFCGDFPPFDFLEFSSCNWGNPELVPFSVAFVKGWRRSLSCLIACDAIKTLEIPFEELSANFKAKQTVFFWEFRESEKFSWLVSGNHIIFVFPWVAGIPAGRVRSRWPIWWGERPPQCPSRNHYGKCGHQTCSKLFQFPEADSNPWEIWYGWKETIQCSWMVNYFFSWAATSVIFEDSFHWLITN